MRHRALALALVASLLMVGEATAHKPSYSNGQFSQKENAWFIQDVDISIVLYHQVTCEASEIWMSFETEAPGEIFFQLGVPVIERLSDYRPSIALLAPGLPPAEEPLPFDVPAHLGVHLIETEELDQAQDFFEPFTQTSSWILSEDTVMIPEAGRGYLVAFHPLRETGKLWVAVGETEDFGPDDWASAADWYEATQTFHETIDYPPEVDPVEEICPAPRVEDPPEVLDGPESEVEADFEEVEVDPTEELPIDEERVESGCSTSTGSPLAILWSLALLAWMGFRRRKEVAHRG